MTRDGLLMAVAPSGGIGDVAVGVKRAFFHSLRHGSIFSLTGEAASVATACYAAHRRVVASELGEPRAECAP